MLGSKRQEAESTFLIHKHSERETDKQKERQTKRVNYGEVMSLQTPQMTNFQPDSKF